MNVGKFTITMTRTDAGFKVTKHSQNVDYHSLLGALIIAVDEIKQLIHSNTKPSESETSEPIEKEMD